MLVEFVSMLTISTSTAITVFIAMFLSVFAFFSPDMVFFYREIGWEKAEIVQEIASEIGFVGTELTFLIFFRQDYLQKKGQNLPLYPLFVAAAINIALYVLLFDSRARILGHFFFLFVAVVFYVITDVRCAILDADNAIFGFFGRNFLCLRRLAHGKFSLFCRYFALRQRIVRVLHLDLHTVFHRRLHCFFCNDGQKSK